MPESAAAPAKASTVSLRKVAAWRGIRALTWDGGILYGCRGYRIFRLHAERGAAWEPFASFRPAWWRNLTSRNSLTSRLMRDGFHSLAMVHAAGGDHTAIGAVPGAIVTRTPGGGQFHITHRIRRGTRPLHITAVPGGNIYWGEYFDNRERAEVHIFASADGGETWQAAYTFPAGTIRHIHNIVYDRWEDCLWILTGDEGPECKVLRATCDLQSVEVVLAGNQQARAVAAIPMRDALYLSTDTPFEGNHILRLTRDGRVKELADMASSSIFGCCAGEAVFFSTMVEPSEANRAREVHIVGSADRSDWQVLARWQKDRWPMRYFQYGNVSLPDGENRTHYLAATTVAVERDDLVTTMWEVECLPDAPMERPLSA